MSNGSSGGGHDAAASAAAYRGVAPGWYQDSTDPTLARYWDGTTLSDHTRPVAPTPAPMAAAPETSLNTAGASSAPAPGPAPLMPDAEAGPEQRAAPASLSRFDKMSVMVARGVTRLLGRTN